MYTDWWFPKMKASVLCVLAFAAISTNGLRLQHKSYLRLPACSDGSKAMFQDAAMKSVYHSTTQMLYVAGNYVNTWHTKHFQLGWRIVSKQLPKYWTIILMAVRPRSYNIYCNGCCKIRCYSGALKLIVACCIGCCCTCSNVCICTGGKCWMIVVRIRTDTLSNHLDRYIVAIRGCCCWCSVE